MTYDRDHTDFASRLTAIEVHMHHLLQGFQNERHARLTLQAEMYRLDEKQQTEINELRKDREALLRRYGGWIIYILACLVGVLVSTAWNVGSPEGVLSLFIG